MPCFSVTLVVTTLWVTTLWVTTLCVTTQKARVNFVNPGFCGPDETRTRDLLRDRQAF
jgi:hypothetical protein